MTGTHDITQDYSSNQTIHNTSMSMETNIVIGEEATKGLMEGIKVATKAIRLSYGVAGCNAVVENVLPPYHKTTNDAQTIIQAVEVKDALKKRGLALLKELSDKADKDSGDGRKTTCIIAETILEEGFKSEISGLALKRELDSFIPLIEKKLDEIKKTITEDEVESVATIAGESKEIGKILSEIYKKIGKEGIIHPEGSGTYATSVEYIDGIRFDSAGFLSPYMVRDDIAAKEGRPETLAIYENPTILVTKRKINHINDIDPLLQVLTREGKKDLVIFTDDMDSGVAAMLVNLHKSKMMNILIIKAPVLWKNYVFEDFAKCVGATIVEDATGVNYKNLELRHLGTCGKLITDKDETVIMGTADISNHIENLKKDGTNDSLLRLSWLANKTAILKLGANNESELSYLMLKTKDAINSSRLALKDGVVPGGGLALENVATSLPETVAGRIIRQALREPLKQNLENMGATEPTWGHEVVDATAVVKNAVRNAISLASTILTTKIVVTIPEPTELQIAMAQKEANRPF